MKTIVLTTVLGALIAVSTGAQAAQFVTDPLLLDFASSGQVINPHGYGAGR